MVSVNGEDADNPLFAVFFQHSQTIVMLLEEALQLEDADQENIFRKSELTVSSVVHSDLSRT